MLGFGAWNLFYCFLRERGHHLDLRFLGGIQVFHNLIVIQR
jgi:hypothetical protein